MDMMDAPAVTSRRMKKEEDADFAPAVSPPAFVPGSQSKFGNSKPMTPQQKQQSAAKLADMLRNRQ